MVHHRSPSRDQTAHTCTLCVVVVYDMGQEVQEESDDHPFGAQTKPGLRALVEDDVDEDESHGRPGLRDLRTFGFDARGEEDEDEGEDADDREHRRGSGLMANPDDVVSC